MAEKKITFALAGNPNSGKTTLFNSLTGSTAYVGNWPGVTVEKREGIYKNKEVGEADIVDLPGIYSLSPYTPEEVISRNFILEEHPDCVINVIDATNLERNLYMTTQLLEMDVPVVVALNMSDAVEESGQKIDESAISKKLGVPVVKISALRYTGLDNLMKTALEAASHLRKGVSVWNTGSEKENIAKAVKIYTDANVENPLFHAIKALEGDEIESQKNKLAYDEVSKLGVKAEDFEATTADLRYKYITNELAIYRTGAPKEESQKLSKSDKIDKVLTNRWAAIPIMIVVLFLIFHFTFSEDLFYISAIGDANKVNIFGDGYPGYLHWTANFIIDDSKIHQYSNGTDILDPNWYREQAEVGNISWRDNPYVFIPFANVFYNGGEITYVLDDAGKQVLDAAGNPIIESVDGGGINSIGAFCQHFFGEDNTLGIQGMICVGLKEAMVAMNWPEWLISFFYDAVMGGISAVLGFVPQILVLFLFFSILEDSGYMARIAFILDRIFRRFGVSGRAFIPMIMGFGCGVPAMINTRTLSSDKERVKTIRVIPFFTCGAKAEFLAVIGAAVAKMAGFDQGTFVFIIYMVGVVFAIASVIVMNHTTQREKVPPFIMELPAYHAPQPHALAIHVWDKGKHYLKKAFTIIFASTVIIWFLQSFTPDWVFIPMAQEGAFGDYFTTLTDHDSILAHIGQIVAPLFTPMGFGNVQGGEFGWTYAVASIQGIVAKENVTATLGQLSSMDSVADAIGHAGGDFADIVAASNATGGHIDTASLAAFAVFNMTTIPCFASVATAKAEMPTRKDYIGTILFWLAFSYVAGCLTYITVEWVWTLAITLPVIILGFVGVFYYNSYKNKQEAKEAK